MEHPKNMPRALNYKRVKNSLPFLLLIIAFFREELSIHVDPLLNDGASDITETKVTDYCGRNTSLYDNSKELYLQWLIEPKNATLDFIKCFQGYEMKPENYFFTYDFTMDRVHRQKELGNRISRTLFYEGDNVVFQLNISQPRSSDVGAYTCLLHAAGTPQERTARLYVKRETEVHRLKTLTSSTSSDSSSDATTHVTTQEDNSSAQGLIIALIVTSVILLVVLVYACSRCYWKEVSDLLLRARVYIKSKKRRTQDKKHLDCVNMPLRNRDEDSHISNQDISDTCTEIV